MELIFCINNFGIFPSLLQCTPTFPLWLPCLPIFDFTGTLTFPQPLSCAFALEVFLLFWLLIFLLVAQLVLYCNCFHFHLFFYILLVLACFLATGVTTMLDFSNALLTATKSARKHVTSFCAVSFSTFVTGSGTFLVTILVGQFMVFFGSILG